MVPAARLAALADGLTRTFPLVAPMVAALAVPPAVIRPTSRDAARTTAGSQTCRARRRGAMRWPESRPPWRRPSQGPRGVRFSGRDIAGEVLPVEVA